MKRWPTKPLGELSETVMGQAPPGNECNFDGKGMPFVKAGEFGERRPVIREWTTKPLRFAKSSDVLVCVVGATCGKLNLGADCAIGRSVAAVRPNPSELHQGFLHAFLRGWTVRLRSGSQGSAQGVITREMLASIPIPQPPLAEQERIVKLLDEADELRKLRTQADLRTAALLPALFHEMFGKHRAWPVEKLESLCKRVTVGHVGPMATEYVEGGVTFLRGQNIKRGKLDLSSVLFVSENFHKRLEKSAIAPGDVVSVRTGKPGVTAVIPTSLKVANCSDLIVMTCGPQLNPHFLCELLNQRLGDKDNIAGATGIAQQHFNIGEARRLTFPLPPLAMQQEFAQRVLEIREMEAAQAASRHHLEALFQSLLHRAFNGDL